MPRMLRWNYWLCIRLDPMLLIVAIGISMVGWQFGALLHFCTLTLLLSLCDSCWSLIDLRLYREVLPVWKNRAARTVKPGKWELVLYQMLIRLFLLRSLSLALTARV
jgi:hypothetical protein